MIICGRDCVLRREIIIIFEEREEKD